MSIAFNQTPGDIEVPLFAAEINAGPPVYSGASRMLLIGRSDEEVLEPLKLVNAGSADPTELCGFGSMLADMLLHARRTNPLGEIYVISPAATLDGIEAEGSITFTGTAKRSGTFTVYIAGEPVAVNVDAGTTAAEIATKFRVPVNRAYTKFGRTMGRPVIATIAGGSPTTVVLTARHSGSEGNTIAIARSLRDGPVTRIPGVTAEIVQMTGGTGGGSVEATLTAVATEPFDWIGSPYDSAGALDAARDWLSDRWGPLSQLYGHYVTARIGTVSSLTAFGATRNDPHVTVLGLCQPPNPTWSWIGALTGMLAFSKNLGRELATAVEIARPMQTLVLPGLIAPGDTMAIFAAVDRDSLLRNGISTVVFRPDGQAACDRIVTTYLTNDGGLPDSTFHDIEDICVSVYVSRYLKNALLGRFPRHVMADENPSRVQGVVTPTQAKACVVHAYEALANAVLVRQAEEFARNLRVEFDYSTDRANFYLPASKVAQLRVFAVNLTIFTDLAPETAQL